MKKNLIIYGIGKFAEYVGYVFQNDSNYEVLAFCVEREFVNSDTFSQQPLIAFEEIETRYSPEEVELFIAVGNNIIRKRIFQETKSKGYTLATYISTKATTWNNLKCGENSLIDEGCSISPFVKIGSNCIIFMSTLGHHTVISDHCLVSAGTLGGNVRVGPETFIGMNAVIKQNLSIAKRNIIGMGCIMERNTAVDEVYSQKGTFKRTANFAQVFERFLR